MRVSFDARAFSSVVRQELKRQGKSTYALREKLGISGHTLHTMLNGKIRAIDIIYTVAAYLDIDPSHFLTNKDGQPYRRRDYIRV